MFDRDIHAPLKRVVDVQYDYRYGFIKSKVAT